MANTDSIYDGTRIIAATREVRDWRFDAEGVTAGFIPNREQPSGQERQ